METLNYQNIARAKAIEKKSYIGQKIGRLYIVGRADDIVYPSGQRAIVYNCLCDCGNKAMVRKSQIINGNTKSCGCIQKEIIGSLNRTHGLSNKCGRLYPLWKSIKYRCYCKTSRDYKNYGGRGIVMCDEWKDDFQSFYEWAIDNGYKEDKTDKGINILTIDRIDVNGNYCPENCRFVPNEVQAKNKRNSILEEDRYRICPVCGKKYRVSKRKGAKTCSYECGFKLRSKTHPNTKDYTKICPICGKRFNAKRGGHFKNAVYCSRKCKDLSCSPIWEYNGESHRAIEWAEIVGINTHCLLHRKDLGWTIEEILTTPLGGKRNAKCKL